MAKFIHRNTIVGQKGVNLVEKIVLDMGFLWNPTRMDAGIDGEIEIRDPKSEEAKNTIIRVQVKATERDLQNETRDAFSFHCDGRDVDYWLSGNAPVILVVCRVSTGDAYWMPVREYFSKPENRKSHTVRFSKRRDRFDRKSADRVATLAQPAEVGLYAAPPPRPESLYSNLMPITKAPETLYIGATEARFDSEVFAHLKEKGIKDRNEFLLKDEQIYALYDLRNPEWRGLCDFVDEVEFAHWSDSDDDQLRGDAVRLLNRCLQQKAWTLGLRFNKREECYHFRGNPQLIPIRKRLGVFGKPRTVFGIYKDKRDPSRIGYCRHLAFEGHFRFYDRAWYLEVNPTYLFTSDGRYVHPRSSVLLKGIREIERHQAVRSQLLIWSDILTEPGDMLRQEYPFLSLGPLERFDVAVGIDDSAWLVQRQTHADLEPEESPLLEFVS